MSDSMNAVVYGQAADRAGRRGFVGLALAILGIAAVVFEQSPANEAIRSNLAFRALAHTGDAVIVGLVVFGLTIVIEGVSAMLVMVGMRANPEAVEKFSARFGSKTKSESAAQKRVRLFTLTDIGVALGIGAAIVVLKRALRPHRHEKYWSNLAAVATIATLVVAVVSGLIGWIVAGGVETAARYGLETPADYVVRYGANWRFWIVMILGAQVISWIYKKLTSATPRVVPK